MGTRNNWNCYKLYEGLECLCAPWAEVDYTTWTIQAIYDTFLNISQSDGVLPQDNGNILWHDQSTHCISIISPTGVLLDTIDGNIEDLSSSRYRSTSDRYVLCMETVAGNKVAISIVDLQNLTKIWRRVVTDDSDGYTLTASPLYASLMGISPSGEWIAVLAKEAVTSDTIIFIYKGS